MRIFISGGCKNGKSYYAQRLAKAQQAGPLYYVAAMVSTGGEDDARIARHRREREGWGFITVEQPVRVGEILRKCDRGGSFLLDSLTALLANEMFSPSGDMDEHAAARVGEALGEVISGIENIVLVSDHIYSDAFLYDPFTEAYRKSLARLDSLSAKCCDTVLEASFSGIIIHKGALPKNMIGGQYEALF